MVTLSSNQQLQQQHHHHVNHSNTTNHHKIILPSWSKFYVPRFPTVPITVATTATATTILPTNKQSTGTSASNSNSSCKQVGGVTRLSSHTTTRRSSISSNGNDMDKIKTTSTTGNNNHTNRRSTTATVTTTTTNGTTSTSTNNSSSNNNNHNKKKNPKNSKSTSHNINNTTTNSSMTISVLRRRRDPIERTTTTTPACRSNARTSTCSPLFDDEEEEYIRTQLYYRLIQQLQKALYYALNNIQQQQPLQRTSVFVQSSNKMNQNMNSMNISNHTNQDCNNDLNPIIESSCSKDHKDDDNDNNDTDSIVSFELLLKKKLVQMFTMNTTTPAELQYQKQQQQYQQGSIPPFLNPNPTSKQQPSPLLLLPVHVLNGCYHPLDRNAWITYFIHYHHQQQQQQQYQQQANTRNSNSNNNNNGIRRICPVRLKLSTYGSSSNNNSNSSSNHHTCAMQQEVVKQCWEQDPDILTIIQKMKKKKDTILRRKKRQRIQYHNNNHHHIPSSTYNNNTNHHSTLFHITDMLYQWASLTTSYTDIYIYIDNIDSTLSSCVDHTHQDDSTVNVSTNQCSNLLLQNFMEWCIEQRIQKGIPITLILWDTSISGGGGGRPSLSSTLFHPTTLSIQYLQIQTYHLPSSTIVLNNIMKYLLHGEKGETENKNRMNNHNNNNNNNNSSFNRSSVDNKNDNNNNNMNVGKSFPIHLLPLLLNQIVPKLHTESGKGGELPNEKQQQPGQDQESIILSILESMQTEYMNAHQSFIQILLQFQQIMAHSLQCKGSFITTIMSSSSSSSSSSSRRRNMIPSQQQNVSCTSIGYDDDLLKRMEWMFLDPTSRAYIMGATQNHQYHQHQKGSMMENQYPSIQQMIQWNTIQYKKTKIYLQIVHYLNVTIHKYMNEKPKKEMNTTTTTTSSSTNSRSPITSFSSSSMMMMIPHILQPYVNIINKTGTFNFHHICENHSQQNEQQQQTKQIRIGSYMQLTKIHRKELLFLLLELRNEFHCDDHEQQHNHQEQEQTQQQTTSQELELNRIPFNEIINSSDHNNIVINEDGSVKHDATTKEEEKIVTNLDQNNKDDDNIIDIINELIILIHHCTYVNDVFKYIIPLVKIKDTTMNISTTTESINRNNTNNEICQDNKSTSDNINTMYYLIKDGFNRMSLQPQPRRHVVDGLLRTLPVPISSSTTLATTVRTPISHHLNGYYQTPTYTVHGISIGNVPGILYDILQSQGCSNIVQTEWFKMFHEHLHSANVTVSIVTTNNNTDGNDGTTVPQDHSTPISVMASFQIFHCGVQYLRLMGFIRRKMIGSNSGTLLLDTNATVVTGSTTNNNNPEKQNGVIICEKTAFVWCSR